MSWTFAEERPIYWEEPPEQIAITNKETGEWDAYMLTSKAMRMIREAKDDANWLNSELHGAELEARKAELGAVAMTEENMAAHGWVRERTGRIKEHETGHLVCSECGAVQTEWTVYYCWNCGAKLETVGARRSRYSVDERIWVDAEGYRVIISDCAVVEHG